ncbi:hypothetical protein SEA_AYOTOYA_51 [Gordonia phage Ayotoya]|nr:hypothetical protein SEA_AYOTOYA_51 [Gordonia phage Ayotoya]URP21278.1 hypothetical protein SEA_CHOP_51 [Gordonia phage Chop]
MTQPGAVPSLANFFSGGGSYFKFEKIGDRCTGTVVTVHDPEPQTDINNQLVYDEKGRQKYQVRIDVQTEYRDPADPNDKGLRTLYVKGWMTGAITDALRQVNASGIEPGAVLDVTCVDQAPPPKVGMRPVNKFAAVYTPPAPGASPAANAHFAQEPAAPAQAPGGYAAPQGQAPGAYGAPQGQVPGGYAAPAAAPAAQAPAGYAAPQAAPAAAPAAAPTQVPAGITPAAWAAMPPETQAQILASTPQAAADQPPY